MPDKLSFADLGEVAELLEAPDLVRVASLDAGKVRTPGVWIRVDAVRFDTLSTDQTTRLTLHLVVGDKLGQARSLAALAQLHQAVAPVIADLGGPASRDLEVVGLVLPGSSAALPCLAVPLDLITTTES